MEPVVQLRDDGIVMALHTGKVKNGIAQNNEEHGSDA
jgi:hypothetical protein